MFPLIVWKNFLEWKLTSVGRQFWEIFFYIMQCSIPILFVVFCSFICVPYWITMNIYRANVFILTHMDNAQTEFAHKDIGSVCLESWALLRQWRIAHSGSAIRTSVLIRHRHRLFWIRLQIVSQPVITGGGFGVFDLDDLVAVLLC